MGEAGPARSTVLLVEADSSEREQFGGWLEEAGFLVVSCPGPCGPDYTCVGARHGTCALLDEADAVVLDMSTESEAVMEGTPSEDLLALYLVSGRAVVVLGSHPGGTVPGQLERLERHPSRERLLLTLAGLFDSRDEVLRSDGSFGPE